MKTYFDAIRNLKLYKSSYIENLTEDGEMQKGTIFCVEWKNVKKISGKEKSALCKYIGDELVEFRSALYDKNENDRRLTLECYTDEFLKAYYTVGMYIEELKEDGEPTFNASTLQDIFCELIDVLIGEAVNAFKVGFSKDFIRLWQKRAGKKFEKFEEAMRGMDYKRMVPEELNTDRGLSLLQRAVEADFVIKVANCYYWNSKRYNKALLAYFCTRATEYLKISEQNRLVEENGKRVYKGAVNWRVFENLFSVKNIGNAKKEALKYDVMFRPNGYEEVDELFTN